MASILRCCGWPAMTDAMAVPGLDPMPSRWRYNWLPWAGDGIGTVIWILVMLVVVICIAVR